MKRLKGFTLVELMIGSLILGLTFVGLLATFIACVELTDISRNYSLALEECRSKIEEINNTSFINIKSTFDGVVFSTSDVNGTGVVQIDDSAADLLEIRVVFSWIQPNGRMFGEDLDFDGDLDPGEDVNLNGELDSPVELISYRSFR